MRLQQSKPRGRHVVRTPPRWGNTSICWISVCESESVLLYDFFSFYNLTAACLAGIVMMVVSTGWLLGNNYLTALCLNWTVVCVHVCECVKEWKTTAKTNANLCLYLGQKSLTTCLPFYCFLFCFVFFIIVKPKWQITFYLVESNIYTVTLSHYNNVALIGPTQQINKSIVFMVHPGKRHMWHMMMSLPDHTSGHKTEALLASFLWAY